MRHTSHKNIPMNALLMDLYELTMAASYLVYKKETLATFDLFIRKMPKERSYFIFAGLKNVLEYLKNLRFSIEDIQYLKSLKQFSEEFLNYLLKFKFTGDVWAMPEGTVFFPEEPVIRVTAPIIEAQIVESALLNIVNLETTMATKASRVVYSAKGRPVYDFSLRRTQGEDAGIQAARCSYIAGCRGTSNVLAGKLYGIPVVGTMAHSFVMSFTSELASFRAFMNTFPKKSILLIDTYNQMQGLENAIRAAKEMGKKGYKLSGIRLDSGDLAEDSKRMREILNKKRLGHVKILASGNLDEYKIKELLEKGAKIDSFGVGTHMGTSSDIPYSDVIYKISSITDAQGRFLPTMKLSEGKRTYPGRKQVYRRFDSSGKFKGDILAVEGERLEGARPLLKKVMNKGKIIYKSPSLKETQKYCLNDISNLHDKYKCIEKPSRYPVITSQGLKNLVAQIKSDILTKSKFIDVPPIIFMDIDTQHDFIHRNGRLSIPGAEGIVDNLKNINEFAKKNGILVFASMDKHSRDDPEFKKFPPHCVIGTFGQEKIPHTRIEKSIVLSHKKRQSYNILKEKLKDISCVILEKNKLSVFTNPNTEFLLKDIIGVYLYGVATEYCVREAALGLRNMDIRVTIIKDAIKEVDTRAGTRAMRELKERGVEFIKTKELITKKL